MHYCRVLLISMPYRFHKRLSNLQPVFCKSATQWMVINMSFRWHPVISPVLIGSASVITLTFIPVCLIVRFSHYEGERALRLDAEGVRL